MIETIRRLLDFSGRCRKDLLCAFGYGVLYSVSEVIPVLAIVVALEAVLSPSGGGWFAVAASGGLMGLSVAGKIVFGKRATERRMLASYDMCADKRIEVGEILKRVPLGYFSQNRLGEADSHAHHHARRDRNQRRGNPRQGGERLRARGGHHSADFVVRARRPDHGGGARGIPVRIRGHAAEGQEALPGTPGGAVEAQWRRFGICSGYGRGEGVRAWGPLNRAVDEAIEACRASNTDLERSFSTPLAAVYQLVFKVAAFGVLLSSGLLYLSGDMVDQMPAHGFQLHAGRAHRNDGQRFPR